jgi:phosphatidylglycerol:prolipoprotein diacylglycerol transferase
MISGITIGNILVPYYGFMIAIGILSAGCMGFLLTKKFSLLFEDFIILYAYIIGLGLLGAKILYIVVAFGSIDWWRLFEERYFQAVLSGGFVFYGGLVGGLIALPIVKKVHKIDVYYLIKIVLPCIPLAHAMGRLGCHFTGCCYGIPYEGYLHIVYHNNLYAPNDIGLFPVQMTEAIFELIMAAVLFIYIWRRGAKMSSVYIYLYSYSIARYILEYLRGDAEERGSLFQLSTSQVISILIILGTTFYILSAKGRECTVSDSGQKTES